MKYTVSLSSDKKYVIVFVVGPMTTELALIVGKEANALATEFNIFAYLYDLRKSRNVQSSLRNYEFGYKEMESAGLNKLGQIALLTDLEDQSHDFIETILKNNGYNVRIFKNEEEAIAWLIN